MGESNWLTQFIFTRTRNTAPDGRPLYAYKCEDKKYEELKEQLIQQLQIIDYRKAFVTNFSYYFCLYAAETFCREHETGFWTWETVFKPLGINQPEHQQIREWIKQGLAWWKRPLIEQNGQRRFLTTIACEGGLPLKLLQKNNAAINQFFKATLEDYHSQGYGGIEIAERIGRIQAHRLPPSLRQDVVFHLGGELIASIVELQEEIGYSNNPIITLDNKVPDWRKRLPLRLEDQTAESLFNGLVIRTNELTKLAQSRLRWIGKLKETTQGWQVQKYLECPDVIATEQLCHWVGSETHLPPRLRILLKTSASTEVIALLTLAQGSGKSASYRREWTRRNGAVISANLVQDQHLLFLHVGDFEYPLAVENQEPWGDLPWFFVNKGNNGDLYFIGEGSRQTRAENAYVLSPNGLSAHPLVGEYQKITEIPQLSRSLYKVSGTVDFLTEEDDRYRITCQAEIDFEESYCINGHTLSDALNSYPLYLGVPRIGNKSGIKSANLKTQWKQLNTGAVWNDHTIECVGRIWLRLFDTYGNIEIFRRQVVVLPKSFCIERTIGQGEEAGSYRLHGLMGALISDSNSDKIESTEDGIEISYPVLHTTHLPPITLNLSWGMGKEVSINLPYPQRGAVFQLAGQTLSRDETVSLERLGGLRLFLQDHAGGRRYWLDVELISADALDCELPRLRFRDRLAILSSGRLETSLLTWQDRIASLLSSSRSLDALIRLEVSTSQGETLARLNIARFDCFLEPNFPAHQVRLSTSTLEKIGQSHLQNIHLEMLPLWSPKDQPIPIEINLELIACWNLPDQLAPGPWWIVGRDGDWVRFRPILWSISGSDVSQSESKLESAIRESNSVLREQILDEVLRQLGENPEDSDWFLLFDLIRLSREFPASSLNVLTRLVGYPQTLALALLKSDDELFDCVWNLAEQLPFSWSFLSAYCWQEATSLYIHSLQNALGEIDINGDIVFGIFQKFRERACSRRQYWSSLCDWLQERTFIDKPIQSSPLIISRRLPSFFDEQIANTEQELQSRHDADEHWPPSQEVFDRLELLNEWHQYQHLAPIYRSVRCAPFLASRLSIKGILSNAGTTVPNITEDNLTNLQSLQAYLVTENLIYELRLLRAFDPDWFDTVNAIALTIELSKLPVETTSHD